MTILKTELKEILSLRDQFLHENNFQIRYNACHERNWTDSYLLTIDGAKIGYGSVKGKDDYKDRDAVFEFFILPSFRKEASGYFSELLTVSKVAFIECQTNDALLSSMAFEFARNINSEVMLFKDNSQTEYVCPEVVFRPKNENDTIFKHKLEPEGEYLLELRGEIVATGGFLLHYNKPFADLYMEVREDKRRKGFGSFLLQELKRACYLKGRIPAARCNMTNAASRAALIKAGLQIAGFMLTGTVEIPKSAK